ncbi:SbtR family transcriptional regulator [Nonomuraea ceibae]|uniref:SbtR family transcriptional regulator n=1 Tax=Nonomuraea ceibae TaxID=1935170 RepID=UPI003558537C
MLKAVETLLARAQEAGAVRRDIAVPELNALLIGAACARHDIRHVRSMTERTGSPVRHP